MPASNSLTYFQFGTRKPNTALPAWSQDSNIYKGTFQPPANCAVTKTTSDRRPASNLATAAKPSGKVTYGFLQALLRAAMVYNGCDSDAFGFSNEYLVAEYTKNNTSEGKQVGPGELITIAINRSNGSVFARSGSSAYKISNGVEPILFAMFALFTQDTEFNMAFKQFAASTDDDEKKALACQLSDIAYYMCKDTNTEVSHIREGSSIRDLTPTKLGTPSMKPTTFIGNYTRFNASGYSSKKLNATSGRAMATADFVGRFKFYDGDLSAEDEALVAKIDEKYIVSEDAVFVCKCLKETTNMSRPIRDILLRGGPGTGKTEFGKAISAGCHLPMYEFSAHAMTEPYDLFGQYVPADGSGDAISVTELVGGLPSAEDMALDPASSYKMITGTAKDDATATECMQAAFQKAQGALEKNDLGQKFVFAPGQLVRALTNGGVWVFDEVSLITNPGVAPSLNPLMDGVQAVTLPNGHIIHRHPNCVFMSTMNIDQEGCRQVNQAWQDVRPVSLQV